MKQEQQQKAREMYFQTNMSKTEIAEKLNVSRRSVFQWSVEGDWEKLRASARSMPAILAEKCYYLIAHFTDHLLSKESFYQSVTKADVDILYKLTKTINLLKKGSTINENMETFTTFLEGLQAKDPALANAVIPHVDSFITGRTASSTINTLDGFSPQGNKPFPEKEIMEKWLDEQEAEAILQEQKAQAHTQQTVHQQEVDIPLQQDTLTPPTPNTNIPAGQPQSSNAHPHTTNKSNPGKIPFSRTRSKEKNRKHARSAA